MTEKGQYFREPSCSTDMPNYPNFLAKLLRLQDLCAVDDEYILGSLIWDDEVIKKMEDCHFPSKYFVSVITATQIHGKYICNVPMKIPKTLKKQFTYIPFPSHSLLVLDAVWKQGSGRRYKYQSRFLYSEHSGVLSVADKRVDQVIVLSNTNRVDPSDSEIFLPTNSDAFSDYPYMFHTHPNNGSWGGRMKDGIAYEFPSASDIYNFTEYYDKGKTQASIIVSPEGMYIIRPVTYVNKYSLDQHHYAGINDTINNLETKAMSLIKGKVNDAASFYKYISNNTRYIARFNNYLAKINVYIEYFPRILVNGEWVLRPVYLPYFKAN